CEKPMAVSLGECDEMLVAARRNEVKLAVAHQRRFNGAWTEARRLVAAGAIGQVRHVHAVGAQGLLNDCSHLLDMMRYVLGDPQAQWVIGNLERKTDRYERDVPIEDRSAGIVQFDNGTIGVLLQELGGRNRQGGVFYGTEGTLDLDEQRVQLINRDTGGRPEDRPVEGEDPAVAQARELVQWVEGTCEHRGQAANGRAAVEIIMAIYESTRRREVVSLPLPTRANPLEELIASGQLPPERPGGYDIRSFLLHGEAMSAAEAWGEGVEPT
ncbi:MAG: Gfo/Idh/MocA family oxidoreductase, partial [Gemmatimonadota bacterium]